MYRILVVESGSLLAPLLLSVLEPPCVVTATATEVAANKALGRDTFHAGIIDMAVARGDPLTLATHAAARGCGTILMPDMPTQFIAAALGPSYFVQAAACQALARAGPPSLCKRRHRLSHSLRPRGQRRAVNVR
jgi:hypothetical protein